MDAVYLWVGKIVVWGGGWFTLASLLLVGWILMESWLAKRGYFIHQYGKRGFVMELLEGMWPSKTRVVAIVGLALTPVLIWPGLLFAMRQEYRDRREEAERVRERAEKQAEKAAGAAA